MDEHTAPGMSFTPAKQVAPLPAVDEGAWVRSYLSHMLRRVSKSVPLSDAHHFIYLFIFHIRKFPGLEWSSGTICIILV